MAWGLRSFVALLLLLLGAAPPAGAQEAAADAEREAVRKVVETYLFSEEAGEKRSTFVEGARIIFVAPDGKQTRVEAVSRGAGRSRKGGRTMSSPQKIVSIDVLHDAASVKVETLLMPDTPYALKHTQYLWLLKTEAGWKLAGILMPGAAPAARRGDR